MTTGPAAAAATVDDAPPTISFPQGMPGFPGATAYRLEAVPGAGGRFLRLRSVADGGPAFVLVPDVGGPAGALLGEGDLEAGCAGVGLDPATVIALLVVTTRRDPAGKVALTLNRRAPVLLDTRRDVAFQVVLPRPDYAVRHPLTA